MSLSTRGPTAPPAPAPPPDRFVTELNIGGLFGNSNARITFGRNKNFLIGPNGSGKTTIVHILASCLRNDFTQLFSLPFSAAEITLRSISTLTETKIAVTQNFNSQSGQRFIEVAISGDFDHQETIEIRDTRLAPQGFWVSFAERTTLAWLLQQLGYPRS